MTASWNSVHAEWCQRDETVMLQINRRLLSSRAIRVSASENNKHETLSQWRRVNLQRTCETLTSLCCSGGFTREEMFCTLCKLKYLLYVYINAKQ